MRVSDDRPRIHIWRNGDDWHWQQRIGHPGVRPHTADNAGDAFVQAMESVKFAPAVIFYGSIPQAPR